MRPFAYAAPASLEEAVKLIKTQRGQARFMAGGTDLLVQMKARKIEPGMIISLKQIPGLSYIKRNRSTLHIGAMTLLADLEKSVEVKQYCPILGDSVARIGSRQVRNLATIGGNICNAAPSADSLPGLIAVGAEAVVFGENGRRTIPLEEFFKGPGVTVLSRDEMLVEIIAPILPGRSAAIYQKHTRREAMDIAVVGVAVFVALKEDGRCGNARVVLGAVAPTPIRAVRAEKCLIGQVISEEKIEEAADFAAMDAKPISDVRSSNTYRSEMVKVYTKRVLNQALSGIL